MATQSKIFKITDLTGGFQDYTSPFFNKTNETRGPAKNFDTSTPGILQRGPGLTRQGATGTTLCKGLGVFDQEGGTHTLYRLHTTTLSKLSGGTWSSVSTGYTNNSTDIMYTATTYTDGAERLYIATGHNDLVGFTTGSSVTSLTDLYAKQIAFYKGRIYLGNVKTGGTVYASRVMYSGIGTDDFATNDYFDDMGEPITGFIVFSGSLYIFTESKVARWDGAKLDFLTAEAGTPSGKSIVATEGRLLYYNQRGIYMTTGYDLPTLISNPVKGYLTNVATPSSVSAGSRYGKYVFFWVGDMTYLGTSYTDLVLIYDILSNTWAPQDGLPMNQMQTMISNGKAELFGADAYTSLVDDTTNTRDTASFDFQWTSPWVLTDDVDYKKRFLRLYVTLLKTSSGNSQTVTVLYRTNSTSTFTTLGTSFITSETKEIQVADIPLGENIVGEAIQIQLSATAAKPLNIIELVLKYGVESKRY